MATKGEKRAFWGIMAAGIAVIGTSCGYNYFKKKGKKADDETSSTQSGGGGGGVVKSTGATTPNNSDQSTPVETQPVTMTKPVPVMNPTQGKMSEQPVIEKSNPIKTITPILVKSRSANGNQTFFEEQQILSM